MLRGRDPIFRCWLTQTVNSFDSLEFAIDWGGGGGEGGTVILEMWP